MGTVQQTCPIRRVAPGASSSGTASKRCNDAKPRQSLATNRRLAHLLERSLSGWSIMLASMGGQRLCDTLGAPISGANRPMAEASWARWHECKATTLEAGIKHTGAPRICVIMPLATQYGGAEQLLLHWLHENLRRPRIDISLVFLEDGPMAHDTARLGYRTTVLKAGRLRDGARFVRTVLQLRKLFTSTRPTAVLSWMPKGHLYVAPAALMAGIPSSWWQHGIPTGHWMDKAATLLPTKLVLCCSRASFEAQGLLRPHRKRVVIYPAVDLNRFESKRLAERNDLRIALGLAPGATWVGTAARLQRSKGIHVFLDAAALVCSRHPQVQFAVIGGEHPLDKLYASELRRLAASRGILSRIVFAGHQPDPERWMKAMDIGVVPSIGAEGFGMVVAEFMALGKPVIASMCGGPAEIITDGTDGLLTPPGDAMALAAAMDGLIRQPAERARLGANALARAQSFGSGDFAERLAQAILEVSRPDANVT